MPDLTLEQKAALVVGGGFWATAGVEEAGIRPVVLTDGPHGVRLQQATADAFGILSGVPATCFPPATGLASSWNRDLVERVGIALGDESRAEGVGVLLGPGVNIKRSPLCGRNFEYFSEDPLLSGELGAAWVRGVQSRGVGAALKHFAVNNQETNRMTVSAEVDERTLREIYLPAFERVVTAEQPWAVMCSYNRINSVAAAENRWLLSDVLRDEWGFRGLVVSDWGAVEHPVASLKAGLDLEMPGPQRDSVEEIVAAVRSGDLGQAVLDTAVRRVRALVGKAGQPTGTVSEAHHHALAREAAVESMVLLRNEGSLLPLDTAQAIGVIGEFARTPRIQGAGSSQVTPTRVDTALDSIGELAPVEFAPGYSFDKRAHSELLITEAVAVATRSDTVLLFVGLPAGDESEGFDRSDLALPPAQVRLIHAVVEANPRTVVILTNGGVVSLEPWHDSVPAIVEAWLLGQAGGAALADVLFGRVAPSGRLAESIPLRLQDTPSYLNFPGDGDSVRYGEGIFVGYRYYETVEVPVRYPFGFGLSYTTFTYSDLELSQRGSVASVTVTNTGNRSGKDVVQLYVSAPTGGISAPRRELRGFEKVSIEAGDSVRVEFALTSRAFSFWDVVSSGWVVAGGAYTVEVGSSAHDIVVSAIVDLPAPRAGRLTLDSRVSDFLGHPVTGPILARAAAGEGDNENSNLLGMVASMPMRRLMRFPGVGDSFKRIRTLVALANNPVVRGIADLIHKR